MTVMNSNNIFSDFIDRMAVNEDQVVNSYTFVFTNPLSGKYYVLRISKGLFDIAMEKRQIIKPQEPYNDKEEEGS
jgi:hypothetical protein